MATSLKIDDTLKGRVQQLASQRRRSPHWIMLEAIQQYVEREEARESFKQEAERAVLVAKLAENGWNVSETARKLEMPRSNLYKKIERYGLQRDGGDGVDSGDSGEGEEGADSQD